MNRDADEFWFMVLLTLICLVLVATGVIDLGSSTAADNCGRFGC